MFYQLKTHFIKKHIKVKEKKQKSNFFLSNSHFLEKSINCKKTILNGIQQNTYVLKNIKISLSAATY
jgi:hypothetical protein